MHFFRSYHLRSLFTRELFEIYFLLALRAFSIAMIGIFLPLYLFVEVGYTLNQVIYFYMVFVMCFGVAQFVATKMVYKWGAKHSMILSVPLLMVALVFIISLKTYPSLLYVPAILQGIQAGFFWMGFHIDAVVKGKKRNFGKESALIEVFNIGPHIIGPIVAGLIIKFFGFNTMYVATLFVLGVSFIPLLFSKEVYAKSGVNITSFFDKQHMKYFLGYFAQGVGFIAGGVFWPLFIFATLGSYLSLGLYGTVATLAVCLLTLTIGKFSDKKGEKRFLIRFFAFFNAVFWLLKFYVTNVFQIYLVGTLRGITSHGIDVPFLAKTYGQAKKRKAIGFILFRESMLRVGQMFALVLVLIVGKLEVSFIAASIASLFFLFF
ncbi:hypothetical protein CL616_05135 [archaeon]|nr:hypothetical protein [archaeon]